MGTHSIADAKGQLPELIDLVLKGENVVITRQGEPVAELKAIPVSPGRRRVTAADLDWLAAHRVGTIPLAEDAGAFVSRMRAMGKTIGERLP